MKYSRATPFSWNTIDMLQIKSTHTGDARQQCTSNMCSMCVKNAGDGKGQQIVYHIFTPLKVSHLVYDWLIRTCSKRVPNHSEFSFILLQEGAKPLRIFCYSDAKPLRVLCYSEGAKPLRVLRYSAARGCQTIKNFPLF